MAQQDETHQAATSGPSPSSPFVSRGGSDRLGGQQIVAAGAGLPDPASLTYELYFGLREKPFSLSPDPRFFFSGSSHGATFDTLLAGIRRREGIMALTGEVGTGKTTLCRAVLQSLDRKTFAAFVPDPFLSREDLLKTLLVDFGVVSVDDIRSGRLRGASRTDLSYPLCDFLTLLQPLQAFAVVMIDEAQNLPTQLLEEIRVLSDLENRQKLLQVLLVGQPELQSRLGTTEMRQLTQRLSVQCELRPLAQEEISSYVSHRLRIAGSNGFLSFTDAAIDLISAASSGIPRVINLVCDRALFRAARARTMKVDAEHILGAVDDLRLPAATGLRALDRDKPGLQLESLAPERQERPEGSATHDAPQRQAEPQGTGSLPTADPEGERTDRPEWSLLPDPQLLAQAAPGLNLGALDDLSTPGLNLEALERQWQKSSARSEQRRPPLQPQGERPLRTTDPTAGRPGGRTGTTARAPFPNRDTLLGSQLRESRVSNTPEAANAAWEEDFAPGRQRWTRRLALVIALLAVTTAVIGYRYRTPAESPQTLQDVLTRPAESLVPPEPVLPPAPPDGTSATREPEPAISQVPVPSEPESARFVLQMASFQTATGAARGVQELQDAGYRAYSAGVALRDGRRVFAVFLGPYSELAQAAEELQRASQIPGYAGGRILQAGDTLAPLKPPS